MTKGRGDFLIRYLMMIVRRPEGRKRTLTNPIRDELLSLKFSMRKSQDEIRFLTNRMTKFKLGQEKRDQEQRMAKLKQEEKEKHSVLHKSELVSKELWKKRQQERQKEKAAEIAARRQQRALNLSKKKELMEQRKRDIAMKEKKIAQEHSMYRQGLREHEFRVRVEKKAQVQQQEHQLRLQKE